MSRQAPALEASAGAERRAVQDAVSEQAQRQAPDPQLTPRQAVVIELAMQGLTNSEIAQRLNVTTHAIKFNLSSAYRKLAVANRTQAAVAYLNYRRQDRG